DSTADSHIDARTLVDSLKLAVELVDRAIAEPVEGTVVSVLKAAAQAAEQALSHTQVLVEVLTTTCDEAAKALANTPSQLEVLRKAGVVDAGGAGLVILLECLLAEVSEPSRAKALPFPSPFLSSKWCFITAGTSTS